jgi:hypothetical protein
MSTGKKDGSREAELEAAIEAIRVETWKTGKTLPKLRRAIALILKEERGGSKMKDLAKSSTKHWITKQQSLAL